MGCKSASPPHCWQHNAAVDRRGGSILHCPCASCAKTGAVAKRPVTTPEHPSRLHTHLGDTAQHPLPADPTPPATTNCMPIAPYLGVFRRCTAPQRDPQVADHKTKHRFCLDGKAGAARQIAATSAAVESDSQVNSGKSPPPAHTQDPKTQHHLLTQTRVNVPALQYAGGQQLANAAPRTAVFKHHTHKHNDTSS